MRKLQNTESDLNTKNGINSRKLGEKKAQLTVEGGANRIFETIKQPKDVIETQRQTRDSINKLLKSSENINAFKDELKKWNKGIDTILENPLEIVTKELGMKLKSILDMKGIKTPNLTVSKIDDINKRDRHDIQEKIKDMLQPFGIGSGVADDYNYSRVINA